MGAFTTDGYNKSRYGDKKIIEIDPLGAALKAAGHDGGASKGGALKASNALKLKRQIKTIQKIPNKNFTSKNSNKSGKVEKKKAIQQQKDIVNKFNQKGDVYKGPFKMATGGRAGYKDGSKGCGKATKGKGRAYGSNS
jgi:hypothetical protein